MPKVKRMRMPHVAFSVRGLTWLEIDRLAQWCREQRDLYPPPRIKVDDIDDTVAGIRPVYFGLPDRPAPTTDQMRDCIIDFLERTK